MVERPVVHSSGGKIDINLYLMALRRSWRKGIAISLIIGLLTFLISIQFPNIYRANGIIAPISDEKERIPSLGAIASFGLSFNDTSKIEELEVLFKSKDLTVRVFKKYDLWPFICPDRYDPLTRQIKESLVSRIFRWKYPTRTPTEWDAIRAVEERFKVATNRRNNTLEISFESPSPEGSAAIVNWYMEEAKSRLQEEALDRAGKNKKFITEQIDKTVDALTRDRLYSIYGQEVEKEMLARNREQFGFKVVDAPIVPDRKLKPHRILLTLSAIFLTYIFYCSIILLFMSSPSEERISTEQKP